MALIVFAGLLLVPSAANAAGNSTTTNPLAKAFLLVFVPEGYPVASDPATQLNTLSKHLVSNATRWTHATGKVLLNEAKSVASSIILMIVFAEISFAACRIMMKASIVEEIGKLVVTTFIYVIVTGPIAAGPGASSGGAASGGGPANYGAANLIRDAMFRLTIAGRNIGSEIIVKGLAGNDTKFDLKRSGVDKSTKDDVPALWGGAKAIDSMTSTSPAEPIVYWSSWMKMDAISSVAGSGDLEGLVKKIRRPDKYNAESSYAFSPAFINGRLFGDADSISGNLGVTAEEVAPKVPDSQEQTVAQRVNFMIAFMPFQVLASCITIGGIQVGAFLGITMLSIGLLVGSFLAFHITAALGVATLPLMYLGTWKKIWSRYLTILAGMALVPFFYYVFSAIGFVFAISSFAVFFPAEGGPKGLGVIICGVFAQSIVTALSSAYLPDNTDAVTSILAKMFDWAGGTATLRFVIGTMMIMAKMIFGSTLIGTFIFGGMMFAALAPQVAFKWGDGFGTENMIDKATEFFNGLQGTLGSGLGTMLNEGLSKTGSVAGGILGGLGKR